MKQDLKCVFGLHKYEIHAEEILCDGRGNIIGKILVCRCANCGKIRIHEVVTRKLC